MERVSIIPGKLPILLVAPHGYKLDDENTDIITEHIATQIDCYAVINRGWERDNKVDCFKDKADCNNVHHCKEDVVREEFLEPLLRYKSRIQAKQKNVFIFYIHGMSNKHKKIAKDENLDVVLGYGAGTPVSYSCDLWMKDLFLHLLENSGFNPYEGKNGGQMSGWGSSNMNQYFRKWHFEPNVHSMQIEIAYELRSVPELARLTAEYLGMAIKDILNYNTFRAIKHYKSY